MIVDDVEQDLDARIVQLVNRGAEFVDVRAGRHVAFGGGEKSDAVIAPIVAEPVLHEMPVVDKGMNRQKLDGSHAELHEMFDHGGMGERAERAAHGLGNVRVLRRHPLHMGFVDYGLVPRPIGPIVHGELSAAPNHTFGHKGRAVRQALDEVTAFSTDLVAEQAVVPA